MKKETTHGLPNGFQGIKWNTHDNMIGSKQELYNHFVENLTKGRNLIENGNYSIIKQLSNIECSTKRCGTICMVFALKNNTKIQKIETIFVYVK